jgi:hypothetical protein
LAWPSKIIVIIQDQNARFRSRALAVEIRSSKAAESRADNNQIVGVRVVLGIRPAFAVAQTVRHFPGTVVAAAHPGLCRRVVRRSRQPKRIGPPRFRRSQRSADSQRESIQKIAARDAAMHPQFAVTRGITHFFLLDIFPKRAQWASGTG